MKLGIWMGSIILSSMLTLFVKSLWEAPRANIEVTSFDLSAQQAGDALPIPADLVAAIANHPFLPDPDSESMSPSEFADFIQSHGDKMALALIAKEKLMAMKSLLQTQSQAIKVETRRREFIALMTVDPRVYAMLEDVLKITAMDNRSALPETYAAAPNPTTLTVRVGDGHLFDLSEIDPAAVAARAAANSEDVNTFARVQRMAERTLLYRRVLRIYDPDVLLNVLQYAQTSLDKAIDDGQSIVAQLKGLASAKREERIVVGLVASNQGTRPMVLRRYGVLKLFVPNDNKPGSGEVSVPIEADGDAGGVMVVEGGTSVTLTLQSDQTLKEIIASNTTLLGGNSWNPGDPDKARFVRMFLAHDGGLEGEVRLARAEFNAEQVASVISNRRALSVTSRSVIMEKLAE